MPRTTSDPAAKRIRLFRWDVTLPAGDIAARLVFVGLALALQNYLEFPRGALNQAIGTVLASLLAFGALSGSLLFLMLALRDRLPGWRWPHSRRVQVGVLILTLAACPAGIHQLGTIAASGFNPPQYANDGTTLDHYAAQQLLEGHNPYVTTNIVAAVRSLHQSPTNTTPLMRGVFASRAPQNYPTGADLRAIFTRPSAATPPPELESHVSYPALSFLVLVPVVWAGLPSVVPFFALCAILLAALVILAFPAELRIWAILLALASAPVWDGAVAGVLDLMYILLLFLAWRWWHKPLVSVLALGLAIAAKQLAWFFLPYYAIYIWQRHGWQEAVKRLAGAGAIFAIVNLPFVANNPRAWLAGVLAPQLDPMFPLGNGFIRLALGGIVPLWPEKVYLALEVLVLGVSLIWYWRHARTHPEMAFLLAVLPLFFAWRSLTTYFYFILLPSVGLYMARALHVHAQEPASRVSGQSVARLASSTSGGS